MALQLIQTLCSNEIRQRRIIHTGYIQHKKPRTIYCLYEAFIFTNFGVKTLLKPSLPSNSAYQTCCNTHGRMFIQTHVQEITSKISVIFHRLDEHISSKETIPGLDVAGERRWRDGRSIEIAPTLGNHIENRQECRNIVLRN
jgi:hypothetical protein